MKNTARRKRNDLLLRRHIFMHRFIAWGDSVFGSGFFDNMGIDHSTKAFWWMPYLRGSIEHLKFIKCAPKFKFNGKVMDLP